MAESSSKSPPFADHPTASPNAWERQVLTRLAGEALKEQRRARRWSIFFRLALLAYLTILLLMYLPTDIATPGKVKPHTALVDVQGVITDGSEASADRIISGLQAAFADKHTAGVIVRINSPGGSPVQAAYINEEMGRLRARYPAIPLYAVVTDMCASGGYYVAVAADKIYADKSSVIGSIGVLMNAFGFVGTMEKLGIERRLLTAGKYKGLLDPFSPIKEQEVEHVQALLAELHRQFIEVVRHGRGARLNGGEELFTGLVWSGEKSVQLGLVDGIGSTDYVARQVIGAEEIIDFTLKRNYLERFAERVGVAAARVLETDLGLASLQVR